MPKKCEVRSFRPAPGEEDKLNLASELGVNFSELISAVLRDHLART